MGRNQELLEKTADDVRKISGHTILVHATDITSESSVENLYKAACKQFEKVDVLVNCAGAFNHGNAVEIDTADWWNDFVSTCLPSSQLS